MPNLNQLGVNIVGGLNVDDQADQLVLRNFTGVEGGFMQTAPAESPNLKNIDFDSQGITKRKGCVEETDLTATGLNVFVGSDVLIAGTEWQAPDTGTRIEILVGKKTIYTNQSGAFVQMNDASSNAYTHNSDVTKVTFAKADGHLFIGLDGANNAIQVYRSGADLDDPFHNHTTTTTVDAASASGQKVLNVTATTSFIVGDRILINSAEVGYVASIQAGVSLTLVSNLASSYTNEAVKVDNLYTNAYGSSANSITGLTGLANYMVTTIHERLCFSDGNSVINYTPMAFTASSGIWDFTNGGFYIGAGDIRALISFTPHLQNELSEQLYIGTTAGFEVTTGFASTDSVFRIEGSESPFNHQSFCNSRNWIIYLTDQKNIMAINGARVIDLGRRAKNTGVTGPLDSFDGSLSANSVYGFYHPVKQQAQFYYTTNSAYVNDTCIVLDFKLGEPLLQESQSQFESHVRLLQWNIVDPTNNDWFVSQYQILGSVLGVRSDGFLYTTESGIDDYGTLAVEAHWFSPVFTAGAEYIGKQWMAMHFRGLIRGAYDVTVDVFLDRAESTSPSLTWQFDQSNSQDVYGTGVYGTAVYSSDQTTKGSTDVDLYSEAVQWKVYNNTASQTFVISSQNLHYMPGTPIR